MSILAKQGSVDRREVRLRRLDGAYVWVEISLRLLDFNDEPSVLCGIHDITHLKAMQEAGLTSREADVALLICDGLSDKVIARRLSLSPHTVRDHLKKIYAKFQINARAQLVACMYK